MIDEAVFDALRAYGHDFLAGLTDQFNEETEVLLVQLRASLEAGDTAAVGRIAHQVKGSAGQLGGRALASACDRIEHNATGGDLRAVELEYEQLRDALAVRVSSAGSLS